MSGNTERRTKALLFLRLYALLEKWEQNSPNPDRRAIIVELGEIRSKLLERIELSDSEWAEIDRSTPELMRYLGMIEKSSLGTARAQENRLFTAPADVVDVLERTSSQRVASSGSKASSQLERRATGLTPATDTRRTPKRGAGKSNQRRFLERAIAGDRQSIERILAFTQDIAVKYCRSRIGHAEDEGFAEADEIAAEIVRDVFDGLQEFVHAGHNFAHYVYKVAFQHVADYENANLPEDERGIDPDPVGDQAHRPRELVKTLPVTLRDILIMRVVVGLTAQETEATLGLPTGSVLHLQHRALNLLRKEIADSPEGLGTVRVEAWKVHPELFGNELRRRRQAVGMSQASLARQVLYSKAYISRVETGKSVPSDNFIQACERALSAAPDLESPSDMR